MTNYLEGTSTLTSFQIIKGVKPRCFLNIFVQSNEAKWVSYDNNTTLRINIARKARPVVWYDRLHWPRKWRWRQDISDNGTSLSRPCIFPSYAEMSLGHYKVRKAFERIRNTPRRVPGRWFFLGSIITH